MSTAEKRRYSVQEYLEFERASEFKHEYYQGEIFAMGGASFAHNQLVPNLFQLLLNELQDGPCQPLASDMRVKVDRAGLYTYPDVTVLCGQPEFEDDVFDTLLNPKVIIEVLSDSTELFDRGEKFKQYRKIESLEQCVLVSQKSYQVEAFTKQDGGNWVYSDAQGLDSSFEIIAIGCTLNLKDVYRRVELSESNDGESIGSARSSTSPS